MMDPIQTRSINVNLETNGKTKKTSVSIDTEDIIAIFAGIVALIFAIGMVAGWIPVNPYTVGIAGFSGAGAAIAKIAGARRGRSRSANKTDGKRKE